MSHQTKRIIGFGHSALGDPVDGYKEFWVVGAEKILAKAEDPWKQLLPRINGLTLDDAIRNARLARILRPG